VWGGARRRLWTKPRQSTRACAQPLRREKIVAAKLDAHPEFSPWFGELRAKVCVQGVTGIAADGWTRTLNSALGLAPFSMRSLG
jgi:hypothetical protein